MCTASARRQTAEERQGKPRKAEDGFAGSALLTSSFAAAASGGPAASGDEAASGDAAARGDA